MLNMQPATAVTIACAVVFGMVLASLGSLKLALAQRLDLGAGRIGTLFGTLHLALIPMMVLSGILIDLCGVTGMVVCGALALAVALFGLAMRPTYVGACIAALVAGMGSACLGTASIVLMPDAFFGPGQASASFNLGTVFFALGALIAPPLSAILLHKFAWRKTLGVLAVVCLTPGVLAAICGRQLVVAQTAPTSLAELLANPVLWLAGLVFFCYAPLEAAVSIWATTYMAERGQADSERRTAWLLSGFWTAFLLSRLLIVVAQYSGFMSDRWDRPLLFVPPLLAAVVLGNLAGTVNRSLAWSGMLLLGFVLGPVFPTLVSLLFRNLQQEGTYANGTAFGLLFALGAMGSLVLAPVIGATVRNQNVQRALRIPTFICLLLVVVTVVFSLLV